MSDSPTLVQWAGGPAALRTMIDAFYDRVESDELLAGFFPGRVSREHREHVADWWAEVFGGPAAYTEQHGGYEAMLAHHRGLGITPDQRYRFVSLMSRAADDAELPSDPEFRSALLAYVEWGTRLAMANSQPDAAVTRARARAPVGLGRRPALDRLTEALSWVFSSVERRPVALPPDRAWARHAPERRQA